MSTEPQDAARADPSAFKQRARQEAERYGADPWVFVRELLQNARDAGAGQVAFATFTHAGASGDEVVICQDDGEGMTFEDARRYLFALYASRKEGQKNQVGKFGVGFWSILRFEPVTISIRSRPPNGPGWGVSLDGDLAHAIPIDPPERSGTEIILRRPRRDGSLAHQVHDAVWQTARHVTRRDDPDAPLEVAVNGHKVNAAFELPAPSSAFRRRNVRGVVGLGPTPRVELFSRGLRVRAAARLEDLLATSGGHSDWMRVQFAQLPDGLAPVALLESAELEVMLSRSDVRDTRALARLVRLAQRELRRLIERQLAAVRPTPWWSQAWGWLQDRIRPGSLLRSTAAGIALLVTVMVVMRNVLPLISGAHDPPAASTAGEAVLLPAASAPYQDLGDRYVGPTVDVPDPDGATPVILRYQPPEGRYHFAALSLAGLAADGAPLPDEVTGPLQPYAPASCAGRRCLQVELVLRASATTLRIPVPTGHRVVAGSVKLPGHAPRLRASGAGQPLLQFDRPAEGTLRYHTVAAPDPTPARVASGPAGLPAALARRAHRLRTLPVPRRIAALLALVQQRVAYDDSAVTAARHRAAQARNQGFIQRTLSIGAGDCDVQNGVLTALAQAAGVPARLAVGYLGESGQVHSRLHGWVEYRHGARWFVADASVAAGPRARADGHPAIPVATRSAAPTGPASEPVESTPAPAELVERAAGPTASSEVAATAVAAAAPSETAPAAPSETAPATVAAPTVAAPARAAAPGTLLWALAAALLLLTAAGGFLLAARTRRAFKLDARVDVAKLLKGALQQPRAFGDMSALLHRPLVPLADGRAISLARARTLGHRGRLFCTGQRSALAMAALRAGAVVLDQRTDEGKAVIDALGAVDLDAWAAMIQAATDDPLLDHVNRILRSHGEQWAVKASAQVSGGVAALDLAHVGAKLPRSFGTRLVMLDVQQPWFAEARQRHGVHPQTAAFMVLDEVARRLGLAPPRRASLLGECAGAAVMENFALADDHRSARPA